MIKQLKKMIVMAGACLLFWTVKTDKNKNKKILEKNGVHSKSFCLIANKG